MPTRASRLALVLAALSMPCSLTACGMSTGEDEAYARDCLGKLQAGRIDEVMERLNSELRVPDAREKLQAVAAQFPPGEAARVDLVNAVSFRTAADSGSNLTFQYAYGDTWLLANVIVFRRGGAPVVNGVHVQRLTASLERQNAFTFEGKGLLHYFFLAAALITLLIVLGALVLCLRTPDLQRRKRWVAFILVGVGGVTLNWTAGRIGFNPLSIHLLGAGALRPNAFAPWVITVSFPLGAVLFAVKWMRLQRRPPPGLLAATAGAVPPALPPPSASAGPPSAFRP